MPGHGHVHRGNSTDAWSDAGNWSTGSAPTSVDSVCIPAGTPEPLIVLNAPASVGSIAPSRSALSPAMSSRRLRAG